jgi:hypothetical protein
MSESVNQHFYANVSVSFLVLCLGIVGAVFMFVGKKSGFHLYIAYSLLAILQMYFFTSVANIPTVLVVMSLIFSALFIFLYAKNLSWMRAL